MRCAAVAIVWVLCASIPALAGESVDLTKIERKIGKLPELKSKSPQYCLLVFGPQATKRVWFVHDGDVLYVDRNGNGDLTEALERVTADRDTSKPGENIFNFIVGDIPDAPTSHKQLRIRHTKWTSLRTSAEAQAILANSESLRVYVIDIEVAIAGLRGSGLDGRVPHSVPSVRFARAPADAPIIHLGGPLEVTLNGNEALRAGRVNEVHLFFGTPGLGPGTFAAAGYENVIPISTLPRVKLSFPPASSGQATDQSYELMNRCCTFSLYGEVRIPESAAPGKATMEISLEGATPVPIDSTVHSVTILPPKPGPTLLPVSSRLIGKLEHAHSNASIWKIRYSPDGKRLAADDFPQGLVHVWDLATGRPTTTIEVGHGSRTLNTYFSVSPDWKTAIGAARDRGVFDRVEVDGKRLNRVTHDSQILEWDLRTGAVLRSLQHEPRRGVQRLFVSPDGRFALSSDELTGTFERFRGQASTLWNLATGVPRDVGQGHVRAGVFAPDSQSFAVLVPKSIETVSTAAIKILAIPDCKEILTIPFDDDRLRADVGRFSADGRALIGATYKHASPSDFQNFESGLVFWDCKTGEQVLSLPSHDKNEAYVSMTESSDSRTLAVASWARSPRRSRLTLVNLADRSVRTIEIADGAFARVAVFHPTGKWLAVATQVIPERTTQREPLPEELPQPKIECVDLASCQIVETIVTPQCYLHSMEFSPDGGTLATSGPGSVLLWDVCKPIGSIAVTTGAP